MTQAMRTLCVRRRWRGPLMLFSVTLALLALVQPGEARKRKRFKNPTRSSTIRLTANDKIVVVVNRETNSLSVLQVRKRNQDAAIKLAEVAVGVEPRAVAVDPAGRFAYVTNGASGTVSVVALIGDDRFAVVGEPIKVGNEPRGCTLTPNGTRLFVANYSDGTVSVIDTSSRKVETVEVGGHPMAIAITNDNDNRDDDETVFVTEFFSELIAGREAKPFDDDARQGVVHAFPSGSLIPAPNITLSPIGNVGFVADRSAFCTKTAGAVVLQSEVYCPDVTISNPADDKIKKDPQGAFPNQLMSAIIRKDRLYLPNIGAGPEPPVSAINFDVNVQALVHVVDTRTSKELANLQVNLNTEVAKETLPADPTKSLDKLFGNDLVAIDGTGDGKLFLIVSRGGNFVFRATADASGKLALGSPVKRFQTGNLPNGVVISRDGSRAYVNNEADVSVTAIDLEGGNVLRCGAPPRTRDCDIPSGTPPPPGTFAHAVLVGKLTFFTALGTPDGTPAQPLIDKPIREILPLESRGKASKNAWSGCASCHPDGLTDNVTWSFPDGPRQTLPLDAFFSKDNPADQRISNWSAVRGSITDFNNNSRGVQGGTGFAGVAGDVNNPLNPNIYNHGITQGASDALDLMTLWVQTVRTLHQPQPSDASDARTLFGNQCASCHGGAKWTKSQTLYADNPAFTADPTAAVPGVPRDPGVTALAGGQIKAYAVPVASGTASITFLEDVGTFVPTNPLEIRGGGGKIGQLAAGGAGFNVPSLLGVANNGPYFHDGSAQTLDDVFNRHLVTNGASTTTIAALLTSQHADSKKFQDFLNSIDGQTEPFPSAADAFRDSVAGP